MLRIPARKGQVWLVPDRHLHLPPDVKRKQVHESRPFLILSGDATNQDSEFPIVLGCPISTSARFATEFCVKLGASEANLPKKSWVRVVAIQPLDVTHLGELSGSLTSERVAEVEAALFQYMGIL